MTNPFDLINSFPYETTNQEGHPITVYNIGLTKREYFAAMRRPDERDSSLSLKWATTLMGTKPPSEPIENIKWWIEAEERYAVLHADALIKALNDKTLNNNQ